MSFRETSAPSSTENLHPVAGPVRFHFQNTYARLPERFYARCTPTVVASPALIKVNSGLALRLGLDQHALGSAEGIEILAGNRQAEGAEPLAQAYAGHQFGYFVPQLGDGRANLLGEVIGTDGARYDLQLKGSGPTPFSRRGDGRAALGPVLREYIVSEAMSALGVPTTRALAAVTTGQGVYRETVQPGAVLCRVAASHLRVGTFQYFAAQDDVEGVRLLTQYAIARHYPDAAQASRPTSAFLKGVIARQAKLVAQWMLLGFIHGVMNTDNTSISGETIDYGPCAFMEGYDPAQVFSSIDQQGRYAYSNQPFAMQWNLTRLAECLLPLLAEEHGSQDAALAWAQGALSAFMPQFEAARREGFRRKLGLFSEQPGDAALAEDLLTRMAEARVDFTALFRLLCAAASDPYADSSAAALFADPSSYDAWAAVWRHRLAQEDVQPEARAASMRLANPVFIPRNHLVQEVIEAAVDKEDYQPFEQLLALVCCPYEDNEAMAKFATPALPEQRVHATFCGT
ncbi:YdiU family protein [Acidipila sp. EB88]|uniref:protein adenylyltransferase SelO n=1 Tax=Acidipila sp. EB88 TaxID=2305226 RepID=UPI000F5EDAF1|nr:YdiU family protein [Acidipila sp. EB88]RRA48708.1 YdiU family protein [Acidipila sp. EB88]